MASKRAARQVQESRAKECAARQHEARRRQLTYEIALFCTIEGMTLYDLFSSREAFEIQNADLYAARVVLRRAASS